MRTAKSRPNGRTIAIGAQIPDLIAPYLASAVSAMDGSAPMLRGMAQYHLGWLNDDFSPAADPTAAQGKLIRPRLAMLCCVAAGGELERAAPLAAAIELLHNFTLLHDDIQDQSPSRRHRATAWRLWGTGQAINAGDALFAAAHVALYQLRDHNLDPMLILRLGDALDRMTINIVQGQVLDLGFEGSSRITAADYLQMIEGKTAAIVRYAGWAGALVGDADEATANRFGEFGRALGLGFQMRDDLLGIWGATEITGKVAADDIRRRKQSLPILLLREQADDAVRAELTALYCQQEIDDDGVARVLTLLEATGVRQQVETRITELHDQARDLLQTAAWSGPNPARDELLDLVATLATRDV